MKPEAKIKRLKTFIAIYAIVAFCLILFNLLLLLPYYQLGIFFDEYGTPIQKLGYFLGKHLLIIFSIFLFLRIYFMNRQVSQLQSEELLDAIDEIGE